MSEFGACSEFVLALEEELGWLEGVALTGYSMTKKEHTWLLIVRVRRAGVPLCLFLEAEDMVTCWRLLWASMHRKVASGWQKDKFARSV